MDFLDILHRLINLGSFSSIWYWLVLAVTWSRTSYWLLGVPWDMVQTARREGGAAQADMEALLAIHLRRIARFSDHGAAVFVAVVAALLTMLGLLGFGHGYEFAQALFLLFFPLVLVGLLSLRLMRRQRAAPLAGPALLRRLTRHRLAVQGIGTLAIIVTGFWGMLTLVIAHML